MTQGCVESRPLGARLVPERLRLAAAAAFDRKEGVRARLISGVFWALVMSLVGQGSVFAASIISARLMEREQFGRLAVIQSTLFILATFAAMGMGITATKYISELRQCAPQRIGRILGVCSLMTFATGTTCAFGLVVAAPWIAAGLLHAPELRGHLQIGALYVFFSALNSYQMGALAGFEAFSRLAWVNSLRGVIVLTLTAALTWTIGLTGAVLAMSITMLCSWGLHQHALRAECRRCNVRIVYDNLRPDFTLLFRFAIPATASGHIGGLAIFGASALLVRQPGGLAQMALFSAADTIRTILLVVPGIVAKVSSPVLCNLRASGNRGLYRRAFWTCLAVNGGLSAIAAAAMFPVASLLLSIFGAHFSQGGSTLRLLLVGAVVEVIATAQFQVLFAQGRMWTKCGVQIAWAACLLGGTWCLAFEDGSVGLASAYLAAWISSVIVYGIVLRCRGDNPASCNLETHPANTA